MQPEFIDGVASTTVEEDRHIIKDTVAMLKPGQVMNCKYRIRHHNSPDVIYCYGTLQLIEGSDGSVTVLRSLLDITEREMMTQISKSNQLTQSVMNAFAKCELESKDEEGNVDADKFKPCFLRRGQSAGGFPSSVHFCLGA